MSSKKLNNKIQCRICSKLYNTNNGLAKHLYKTHLVTSKEYYVRYLGITDNCSVCSKETSFINLTKGFRLYCSRECQRISPLAHIKRTKARKITYQNNPNIQINAIKKYKETIKNDPTIIKTKEQNRQITLKNNPEIQIKSNKNMKKAYKNNPEILTNRAAKRYQTFENNPRLMDNISISLRNKYNELKLTDSKLLYYLYIIQYKNIIKIGVSENPKKRAQQISIKFPYSKILHITKNNYNFIINLEKFLHTLFQPYCQVQPKDTGSGRTEWFCSTIKEKVIIAIDQFHL